MEKVPIVAVKAKANRKDVEVEAKSETGEANGNKSGDAEVVAVSDDSGKKQSLAEDVRVSKMASGKIKPDESASVEQGVGESKTVSETEKMLESMKELNKKLMEMTYKGKLTCEYDKKDMKSKNKSNDDDDDDEEPVKGCMSWLL
ncbi:probable serine/threonine-protein kinase DDB_G0267686 isoform X2 [Rosa chinensis]|uniref:probable serine/threonine-protein kinase DDB_G0267686 isoform X2 n=1 Tax=Rosa chinensis TaxID=74649 RepID=UPI000D08E050|nr:probable serine/threonine-protein kinase DDB_G0267686 isoform X2 [Rosa chinensis]